MSNVAPQPGELCAQMPPPLCFKIPYAVARPSPVPLPAAFVVKNGSKMRACVASSMPTPVSVTEIFTYEPGLMPRYLLATSSSTSAFDVAICSEPPFGIASRAFTTRFISTCSICPASAFVAPSPGPGAKVSSTSSPSSRRSIFSSPPMSPLRSSTSGRSTCFRLNARSCRVSPTARMLALRASSMSARTGSSSPSASIAKSV